jgi:hypothetical protein
MISLGFIKAWLGQHVPIVESILYGQFVQSTKNRSSVKDHVLRGSVALPITQLPAPLPLLTASRGVTSACAQGTAALPVLLKNPVASSVLTMPGWMATALSAPHPVFLHVWMMDADSPGDEPRDSPGYGGWGKNKD